LLVVVFGDEAFLSVFGSFVTLSAEGLEGSDSFPSRSSAGMLRR
jgi:hypothetical protein